jgi:hypothetical protein
VTEANGEVARRADEDPARRGIGDHPHGNALVG